MKKLIRLLALALFAISFPACSNDKDSELDGNHRLDGQEKPVVYKYKLALGGDYVEQSEEPLSRADAEVTYIGINVKRRDKEGDDDKSENYAYGVFSSQNDITISLQSGYVYDFEATILIDGTDKLQINSKKFDTPFRFRQGNNESGEPQNLPTNQKDNFIYFNGDGDKALKGYLCQLSSGNAFVKLSDQPNDMISSQSVCNYPRVKRFYGIEDDVDPDKLAVTGDPIVIPMSYKCFGLKIKVNELPDGTTLTVKDSNLTQENLDKGNAYSHIMFPQDLKFSKNGILEWEDVYSLNDLTQDSPISFKLVFKWDRGVGKTETFENTIQVEPKIKKVLLITIKGTANNQHTGNIILDNESTDLEPDEVTIDYNGN